MKIVRLRPQFRYLGPPEGGEAPPASPPPPPKTFDQKAVDEIVSKRLSEAQRKFDQQRQSDLEKMKALETDASKVSEYEKQIEELNLRYKSKEELAADAFKKEKASWEDRAKKADAERDSWRKRWEENHRDTELMAAATTKELDVKSAEQMLFILKPMSSVKQKVVEGKPIDAFETRISFPAIKDGKTQVLDLSPAEAIKLMKDDVPRFGNLFNAGLTGGQGNNPGQGKSGSESLMDLPQDEFTKRYLQGTLPKKAR